MSDKVGFTADVDVPFMGATAQSLIQRSTVPLLFIAVHLPNQDVICPQHFIFTVCAKPEDKKKKKKKEHTISFLLTTKKRTFYK